ncbi:GDSL esterase/lipase at5g55050 [Phtheirospermum japonicum]|uniref:GDSL esterase/lipase at5g55050 n=1 Tax=Phtheirospermum japonicum TaxID=374723 RepID=A0A830AXM3_9LAMI|nr:GDSL esterase/lipase at5g55050 [Phtheirospermum japonicum]
MYVFGDSLVDVGNNDHLPLSIIKANFPYNGIDYPGQKATGRFCNGKNAADILVLINGCPTAEKLGLSTAPPYLSQPDSVFLKGVNFASGGAGIFNATNENLIKYTVPLARQVEHFSNVRQRLVFELGHTAAQEHLSKSLFPIIIGSNDIIYYFISGSKDSNSSQQHVTLMVSTLKQLLKGMYGLGARKFIVIGIAPIGCIPLLRSHNTSNECNNEVNYWSNKYNYELTQMLGVLQSELNEFHYSYYDAYGVLLDFIQRPASYGFNETISACCGLGRLRAKLPCTPLSLICPNRRANLFWDAFHPTEAAARMLIDMLFSGSGNRVFPMTMTQLISM